MHFVAVVVAADARLLDAERPPVRTTLVGDGHDMSGLFLFSQKPLFVEFFFVDTWQTRHICRVLMAGVALRFGATRQ